MRPQTHRILVVEDHELWRRRVCSELEKISRYRVVGEVSDGAVAVYHAAALKPDVILLDIGLDSMNGIEAARAILDANPGASVLFLTAQRSPDIAEAALATGARGYLLKSEAAGRLELAIETLLNGGRFVSPGLPPSLAAPARASAPDALGHAAVFRGDEETLVEDYAAFAQAALHDGKVVLAVCETARLEKVRGCLAAKGVAVDRAITDATYVPLDSAPELSRLLRDGCGDEKSLRAAAAQILSDASRRTGSQRRVAMFGAIAPPLWTAGHPDAAIQIEQAWDDAVTALGADLLCGYLMNDVQLAENRYDVFREVCARHRTVHVHQ
jgi:DNA-binding NarL/FixJ family response regulator